MKSRARHPWAVWAVSGLWGALLVAYTFLFPVYRAPDEHKHVDLILAVQQDWDYPRYDERRTSEAVFESLKVVRFDEKSFNLTAEEAPARRGRPRLAGEALQRSSEEINQMPQHPPLYYFLMAGVSTAVEPLIPGSDDWPFDKTVWFLRLLNVLLILPLPYLAYRTTRELGWGERAGVAASILPLAIPQLAHIGSSVNNDNLLTLLVGVLTLLLVRVVKGDLSRTLSVVVGAVGGAALLTKGFALFLPVWVVFAYWLGRRRGDRSAVLPLLLSLLTMMLVGGWWWVRNAVAFGSIQPGVSLLPPAPEGFTFDLAFWAKRFLGWMVIRFWGWFGWFDVRLPLVVVIIATLVLAAALVAAFIIARRRSETLLVLFLLTPLAGIGALTAAASIRGYLRHADTPAIQGRYLFPAVVGLVVVGGYGASRLIRSGRVGWLLAGALALHAAAAAIVVPSYWGAPSSDLGGKWAALLAWSPWPPAVPAVSATILAFAILVWLSTTKIGKEA